MVGSISPVVYDFDYNFRDWKSMSVLLIIKKGILNTVSSLTSAKFFVKKDKNIYRRLRRLNKPSFEVSFNIGL